MIKHSFTAQHLQGLTILVSQAVISLENAYLYYQATHDALTGFANRNLLFQIFQQSALRLSREAKQLAIIFLDLDYFKTINDTMGHEVGDKLLIYLGMKSVISYLSIFPSRLKRAYVLVICQYVWEAMNL